MQTLSEIKEMLAERGLTPRKSLGQNFLHDHNLIRRLVDESGVGAGDVVLEVGPGTGALTEALLERGCEVIACEKDDQLAELLRGRFGDPEGTACPRSSEQAVAPGEHGSLEDSRTMAPGSGEHGSLEDSRTMAPGSRNVVPGSGDVVPGTDPKTGQWHGLFTLIHGDCLESKRKLNSQIDAAIGGRAFRMVANLPYHVASPLMINVATQYAHCLGQYVTIQKEVADRVRADVGTKDYSELTVMIRAICSVRRIAVAPPGCFWPQPKIVSEMIAIEPLDVPLTDDVERLERLCRTLFTKRRKQIGSILGRDVKWPEGVRAEMRPEELGVEQLVGLAGVVG